MDATTDRLTDRAATIAAHLRTGDHAAALRTAQALRALLDGLCHDLTIASIMPATDAELSEVAPHD